MSETATPIHLPTERTAGCPFDPPAELARLREESPVVPMVYPDGHVGWFVTPHALVREVLADPRFSRRAELTHNPLAGTPLQPAPPGIFTAMDPPEHTRYRRQLTGQFTVRRMRQLTGQVEQIATEHLDAMEEHGPPADLVTAFAQPIPGLVISELLGVPSSERARFQDAMRDMLRLDTSLEEKMATFAEVQRYMYDLVLAKRAEPTDDLLSGLISEGDLTDEELAAIGSVLIGAGFDTTANMLALGAYALISRPDQLAAFQTAIGNPAAVGHAVEELMRYLTIVPMTMRTALEDVELGGQVIKAGQTVTVSLQAANRDGAHFGNPDTLGLEQTVHGHVGFGHGIHQCLGQQLARVEMQVGFSALFSRFPALRLAVPPEEVPMRDDMAIYGVHRLPVTWD
ncbi:cytochrome P450 [Flindersiella endophytica]